MEQTRIPRRREVLLEQGAMILACCEASVSEPADRADVLRRHEALIALHHALDSRTTAVTREWVRAPAQQERRRE